MSGKWVVMYNTGAGEYSDPYFVSSEEIAADPSFFAGRGHTNYESFNTEAEARKFTKNGRDKAAEYDRDKAQYERYRQTVRS